MSNKRDIENNLFADPVKYNQLEREQFLELLGRHLRKGTFAPAKLPAGPVDNWQVSFFGTISQAFNSASLEAAYWRVANRATAEDRQRRLRKAAAAIEASIEALTAAKIDLIYCSPDVPDGLAYYLWGSISKRTGEKSFRSPSDLVKMLYRLSGIVRDASDHAGHDAQENQRNKWPELERDPSAGRGRPNDVFGDALFRGLMNAWRTATSEEPELSFDDGGFAKVGFGTFFEEYFREAGENLTAEVIIRRCQRLIQETK